MAAPPYTETHRAQAWKKLSFWIRNENTVIELEEK